MDPLPRPGKNWSLTQESLDRLLARLDADRERAGEEYEKLRCMLISFFEWRGCVFPEEQADETLNRVTRKLDEGEEIRDLHGYCHGIARRVWLEVAAKQRAELKRRADSDDLPDRLPVASAFPGDASEADRRLSCFEHCLNSLPTDNRMLIIQYYQEEKRAKIDHRVELARHLGLSLNHLRVRAFRIRAQLDECISRCLRQAQNNL